MTFDISEGTDSTDTYNIGTELPHFHWWMVIKAIWKRLLGRSVSQSVNNTGLKDASKSKKILSGIARRGGALPEFLGPFFTIY